MALEAGRIASITAAVGHGATKEQFTGGLSPEESQFWDQLAAEQAANGGLPIELPALELADGDAEYLKHYPDGFWD